MVDPRMPHEPAIRRICRRTGVPGVNRGRAGSDCVEGEKERGRETHVFQHASEGQDEARRLANERHRGEVERKGEARAAQTRKRRQYGEDTVGRNLREPASALEEEVRQPDEVHGVLEHLESLDGEEDDGVDGETDGCHVVQRGDRVEAKALEKLLHENEPARLDADGEGLREWQTM